MHRQLERLAEAGLVTVTPSGNQKYYRANREAPIFAELHGLVTKTVGLAEPLRQALGPLVDEIRAAFVYGSFAKGSETARSDIDMMVVSDSVQYSDVYEALQRVQRRLGRPVNPTVLTPIEWKKKRAQADSFVAQIAAQERVFIIGSPDGLD